MAQGDGLAGGDLLIPAVLGGVGQDEFQFGGFLVPLVIPEGMAEYGGGVGP